MKLKSHICVEIPKLYLLFTLLKKKDDEYEGSSQTWTLMDRIAGLISRKNRGMCSGGVTNDDNILWVPC